MRRRLVWAFGVVAVLAAAGTALAAGTTTQTISGRVTPSNLPEGKRVGVSLKLNETIDTTDPSGVQTPTLSTTFSLDKDLALRAKGLPRCSLGQVSGKSTADAEAACGSAKVGSGSGVARVSNGIGGHIDLPAVVTLFNGEPQGGRPTVITHVVVGTIALDHVLVVRRTGGAYRTVLAEVPGPPDPIHSLTLTLHRSFSAGGKPRNYISARCSHKWLLYKGRTTYVGGPPLTATSRQRCTKR
jgi:hypothetical protein